MAGVILFLLWIFISVLATMSLVWDELVKFPPLWNMSWSISSRDVVVTVAWAYMTFKVMAEGWKMYMARESGEMQFSPFILVRRTIYTVAALAASGVMADWTYGLSASIATKIVGATFPGEQLWVKMGEKMGAAILTMTSTVTAATAIDVAKTTVDSNVLAKMVGGPGVAKAMEYLAQPALIATSVFYIIPIIFVLIVMLQTFLRWLDLTLIYVLGPLFCLSALSEDDPLRNGPLGTVLKELTVAFFATIAQSALCMGVLLRLAGIISPLEVIVSIPLMIAATKVPGAVRSFVYGQGSGSEGMAASGATAITHMVMRKMPF